MLRKIEPRLFPARLRLYHCVARFGRAAGLGGHYRERLAEIAFKLVEHQIVSVGVGIIKEVHLHLVRLRATERLGNKLRPQGRSAYAYAQDIFKFSVGAAYFAAVDFLGKVFYFVDIFDNLRLYFGSRRKFGRAEPVVPHHSVFIGIGYRPAFERNHRRERLFHRRLH